MSQGLFHIVEINPNDVTGGGGCMCSPQRPADSGPLYAAFPGNDMESIASPHAVICEGCARAVVRAMDGEVLRGGETGD